jgi:ABC-type amino acid transport substrate-binding protein
MRTKSNRVPKNSVVVKGPISYHLLFSRAPQFGHASAVLLTSNPQSLHFISVAIKQTSVWKDEKFYLSKITGYQELRNKICDAMFFEEANIYYTD